MTWNVLPRAACLSHPKEAPRSPQQGPWTARAHLAAGLWGHGPSLGVLSPVTTRQRPLTIKGKPPAASRIRFSCLPRPWSPRSHRWAGGPRRHLLGTPSPPRPSPPLCACSPPPPTPASTSLPLWCGYAGGSESLTPQPIPRCPGPGTDPDPCSPPSARAPGNRGRTTVGGGCATRCHTR